MWRGRSSDDAVSVCRLVATIRCLVLPITGCPRFHIPLISRVEDWRANSSVIRMHYVSSPLRIERSGRISRTALPCVFHAKVYVAYHAGAAFDAGLRTR
jgi:hypothetical protein